MKHGFVYILASQKVGTPYIGVTSNLMKRIYEHKNNLVPGFTSKYNVHRLVYYESHPNIEDAIRREKQMKEWRRAWKIQLIEKDNPFWNDLYETLTP